MPMARDVDANAMLSGSGYGRTWRSEKNAGWNRWKGWTLVEGIDPFGATEEDVARFVREYEGMTRKRAKDACAAIFWVYRELGIPYVLKSKVIAEAKRGVPTSVRVRNRETPYMKRWLEKFKIWCDLYEVEHLPASVGDVLKFLRQLEPGYQRRTLLDVAVVIGLCHSDNGFDDPVQSEAVQSALKGMKGKIIEGDGRRLRSLKGVTARAEWFEWCLERGMKPDDADAEQFCEFLSEAKENYGAVDDRLRFVTELYRGGVPGQGGSVEGALRDFLESSFGGEVVVESELAAIADSMDKAVLCWNQDAEVDGHLTEEDLARVNGFMEASVPRKTYLRFQRDWAKFKEWCTDPKREIVPLKAGPSAVCGYLSFKAERLEASSVRAMRDSLLWWFSNFRLEDNPVDTIAVKRVMKGIQNEFGRPAGQMSPIRHKDYESIMSVASERRGGESRDAALLRGAVDVAIIGLLRDGMLRCGEAARARWEHLERQMDGGGALLIPRSKNDQQGEGAVVRVSPERMDALDYMQDIRRALQYERSKRPEIFTLSSTNLYIHVREACEWAGLVIQYGTHSCRIGMAQDLASAGFTVLQVMAAGRWKNPRMPAYYIRNIELMDGAVAQYYARGAGALWGEVGALRGYGGYFEDGGGVFGIGKKSTMMGM